MAVPQITDNFLTKDRLFNTLSYELSDWEENLVVTNLLDFFHKINTPVLMEQCQKFSQPQKMILPKGFGKLLLIEQAPEKGPPKFSR